MSLTPPLSNSPDVQPAEAVQTSLQGLANKLVDMPFEHVDSFKKTGVAYIVVSFPLLHNVRNRPNCEGANA